MNTYPNPFGDDDATLTLSVPFSMNASIVLIDMSGTEMHYFVKEQDLPTGTVEFRYPTTISAGMYIVKMITNNGIYRTKCTKIK